MLLERGPELVAAAPMAARRRRRSWQVVPVGDGPSDRVQLPATEHAAELAQAVRRALDELGRPWSLRLRHVDPTDAVVAALLRELPHAALMPGDLSPTTVFGSDRDVRGYLSRNAHQQVRRMCNRIAREGHRLETAVLRSPAEVSALLPEVERVYRARDLQLGRRSAVDDPVHGPFLRGLLPALAADGAAELTVLRLDGVLAAYVLCLVEPRARRMWNCRFDPAWERYGPGRLALHAALEQALADPDCQELDWMRGTEPYKAQLANAAWQAADLYACSGALRWQMKRGALEARVQLRAIRDAHPPVARAVERMRYWLE